MIAKMLKRLGYHGEVLNYVTRKVCGIWFLWIGAVTLLGICFAKHTCINPIVFILGYGIGFYLCYGNRKILFDRLAIGQQSPFQKKMSDRALAVLAFLCAVIGTINWITKQNARIIWLSIFLAVGIHFFVFYFVHGAPAMILGGLCTIYAVVGLAESEIPFAWIGTIDGLTKMVVGVYLLIRGARNNENAFYRKYFNK